LGLKNQIISIRHPALKLGWVKQKDRGGGYQKNVANLMPIAVLSGFID